MAKIEKEKRIQRLKDVIKEEKITAYEIAKHTSLSEAGINKILSGKIKTPNVSTMAILANFLHGHYRINPEWIDMGADPKKYLTLPNPEEFAGMSTEDKKAKLNEVAVFIAHHEEEMLGNPIFKNLVERKSYELAIKMIQSENWK